MVVMMWLLWQLALLLAMVSARHSKITPRNLTSLPRVPNLLPSEMPNMTDILLERFIIVPEHKLLFCYIEKVACTKFNGLFNAVRGISSKNMWYHNSAHSLGWKKDDLANALVDPEWQKAVFYREPLERFLSAFLSKCAGRHDRDGPAHCKRFFGLPKISATHFSHAVASLATLDRGTAAFKQIETEFDAHFTRQAKFCGGLDRTLQYYDTVVQLTHDTAREEVVKMLEKSGIAPANVPNFDKFFPPSNSDQGALSGRGRKRHTTSADAHIQQYYSRNELTATVVSHFLEDYLLFGIKAPPWVLTAIEHSKKIEHSPEEIAEMINDL